MQQTENYKLNLIETSDPFSPAPLNENAEKTEAALTAETAARTAGDAALDARVTVLELKKVVAGSYVGNSQFPRVFDLGFTPKVVIIIRNMQYSSNELVAVSTGHPGNFNGYNVAEITDTGFTILPNDTHGYYLNNGGQAYCYIAIG